jgi:hypothetical protein
MGGGSSSLPRPSGCLTTTRRVVEGGGSPIERAVAGLLLVLVVLSPPAWAQDFGRPSDERFRVSWEARSYSPAPSIEGYVHNDTLYRVSNVRLRVEGFDAEKRPVGERFVWAFGDIAPRERSYFVAPSLPRAATYRITVSSFDVVSRGGP